MTDNGETPMQATARTGPKLPPITDHQARVLDEAAQMCDQDPLGRFPTLKHLAIRIGRSKGAVVTTLTLLREAGCLDGIEFQARGMWLTEIGHAVVKAWRANQNTTETRRVRK